MSSAPKRRRQRGSAWYWKQTDSWYFTPPGTKMRTTLKDEFGRRIRGLENKRVAEAALDRLKAGGRFRVPLRESNGDERLVAAVCSEFIAECDRRAKQGDLVEEHAAAIRRYLNDLCVYCGALPVRQLKRGHIDLWLESHAHWRSPVTHRNAITAVSAAFRYAADTHGLNNPLRGLKKPPHRPRLGSLEPQDEAALYRVAEPAWRDFLFAAIHTGARPFCELARLKVGDVEMTPRGMLWRIRSTKTKKVRRIPVCAEVARLVKERVAQEPADAPLFVNHLGTIWKKPTFSKKFRLLKRKLGWDRDPLKCKYSAYTCRHTFAHRLLSGYWNNGRACSIETLAELMGNTPQVAYAHYGREWGRHYQDPLWKAVGVPPLPMEADENDVRPCFEIA